MIWDDYLEFVAEFVLIAGRVGVIERAGTYRFETINVHI